MLEKLAARQSVAGDGLFDRVGHRGGQRHIADCFLAQELDGRLDRCNLTRKAVKRGVCDLENSGGESLIGLEDAGDVRAILERLPVCRMISMAVWLSGTASGASSRTLSRLKSLDMAVSRLRL